MTSNRLLVIDDDAVSSAMIGRIARTCGFDTIVTTDSDDFRSRVLSWEPTVVVLDLALADMDGMQVMAVSYTHLDVYKRQPPVVGH